MTPLYSLAAAILFGGGTAFIKHLLGELHPLIASGTLYLGSAIAVGTVLALSPRGSSHSPLTRRDLPYILGMILTGGILAPGFLCYGLQYSSALTASLLLNLELVFTVMIALALGERLSVIESAAAVVILAAAVLISSGSNASGADSLTGSLAIAAACAAWGADNNIMRFISGRNPFALATIKGFAAAGVSLAIGTAAGAACPEGKPLALALIIGAVSYGASLVLFIVSLRGIGAARTGAFFAAAPFAGAIASLFFGESLSPRSEIAGALMIAGVLLLIRGRKTTGSPT